MAHHHEHNIDIDFGTGKKNLKSYLIGFVLCVILTLIPFALVAQQMLQGPALYYALIGLAMLQLYVQVVCFLRINASPKGRWNLVSLLFTILIVLVVVIGSLWIMYNLNYNMMH